jgi:hypothetical protein
MSETPKAVHIVEIHTKGGYNFDIACTQFNITKELGSIKSLEWTDAYEQADKLFFVDLDEIAAVVIRDSLPYEVAAAERQETRDMIYGKYMKEQSYGAQPGSGD